jgi:hypothetical protein
MEAMFLRNIRLCVNYAVLKPKRPYSSSYKGLFVKIKERDNLGDLGIGGKKI